MGLEAAGWGNIQESLCFCSVLDKDIILVCAEHLCNSLIYIFQVEIWTE